MKYAVIVIALFFPAVLSAAGKPVTGKNWMNHPSIVEIRRIFSETEDGIGRKTVTAGKPFEREASHGGTETYVLYKDSDGRVLKCTREGGSEDSAYSMAHYYDSGRKLRFVFVKVGSVNGAVAEYRIYFDDSKNRIWQIRDFRTSERYPFAETWPDDLMLFDPVPEPTTE